MTYERHAAIVQWAFAHRDFVEKRESGGEQSELDPEHCSFVQSTPIMQKVFGSGRDCADRAGKSLVASLSQSPLRKRGGKAGEGRGKRMEIDASAENRRVPR